MEAKLVVMLTPMMKVFVVALLSLLIGCDGVGCCLVTELVLVAVVRAVLVCVVVLGALSMALLVAVLVVDVVSVLLPVLMLIMEFVTCWCKVCWELY